ncbi:MAG: hypothetical protein NTW96_12315 [Planctomycetia bacterium]|nr:hypothetical protein [Planctomycetia bacterium]
MPRRLRVASGGYAYHVPNRAVGRMRIISVLSNLSAIIQRVADLETVENTYAIAATTKGERLMRWLGFELHSPAERRKDRHNLFVVRASVAVQRVLEICGNRVAEADTLRLLDVRMSARLGTESHFLHENHSDETLAHGARLLKANRQNSHDIKRQDSHE